MVIKAPPTTLTIHEIYQRIISDNDLFIVDVRNQEDFATWHIETAQEHGYGQRPPISKLLERVETGLSLSR
ncbi:MAG: rhodanese-like domain-containing protein [Anaerolineae bacterium]|nr:rhodanese-like domain-containing protein [Anaerolineae bacterium]